MNLPPPQDQIIRYSVPFAPGLDLTSHTHVPTIGDRDFVFEKTILKTCHRNPHLLRRDVTHCRNMRERRRQKPVRRTHEERIQPQRATRHERD